MESEGGEMESFTHTGRHGELEGIAQRELAASLRAAEIYRKNYNAWTHRSALLLGACKRARECIRAQDKCIQGRACSYLWTWICGRMWVASQLAPEHLAVLAESSRRHCRMNVSDTAAQHFRCAIIQLQIAHLLGQANGGEAAVRARDDAQWRAGLRAARDLVCLEQEMTQELIESFPGHQSLWICIRWLFDATLFIGRDFEKSSVSGADSEVLAALRPLLESEVEAWRQLLLGELSAAGQGNRSEESSGGGRRGVEGGGEEGGEAGDAKYINWVANQLLRSGAHFSMHALNLSFLAPISPSSGPPSLPSPHSRFHSLQRPIFHMCS